MSIFSFLSGLIEPITKMVDDLTTSDEERMQIKAKIYAMQNEFAQKLMDYEKQLLESKSKIITAEAQGASWLQRNWRPITMLTFLVYVGADIFGITHAPLAPQAWTLLQIGLGGYVVGRSVEKITPKIKDIIKK